MEHNVGDSSPWTVLVVDDQVLVAHALVVALRGLGWEAVDGSGDLSERGVLEVAERVWPHVVVLDLGIERAVSTLVPALCDLGARVVALVDRTDRNVVTAALEAGVSAFASKQDTLEHLARLVRDTAAGRHQHLDVLEALFEDRTARREQIDRFERLTPREREVLSLLMAGRSTEEIARLRFVSMPTVRSQVQNILRKLGVNSQLGAVALAQEFEWDPTPTRP